MCARAGKELFTHLITQHTLSLETHLRRQKQDRKIEEHTKKVFYFFNIFLKSKFPKRQRK